jgi:hypothetical protein
MPHPEAAATDAVLLVHLWLEPGHPRPLRARVCATDLETPPRSVLEPYGQPIVTSVEDVLRAIQIWLDEFVTSAAARE